jgi:hypothetical protein
MTRTSVIFKGGWGRVVALGILFARDACITNTLSLFFPRGFCPRRPGSAFRLFMEVIFG